MALLVFFLSGFAALLYQVVWQRLLMIFSGADVYSATLVVAAFMGGLGAGSLWGGRAADRLGPAGSLRAFAAAELMVGLFGLASKGVYYDSLYGRYPHLAATPALTAVVLFATLLAPTFLMGLSLPLLARGLTRNLHATPRMIGTLYGFNTLGAAAGAFTAPWVLIPKFGLERSLWIAAALNVLCAVVVARVARSARTSDQQSSPAQCADRDRDVGSGAGPFTPGTWVAIYGLTGFVALGFEITWFRLLGVLLKSTSFTFGTLLAVYLGGLGAGAAVGARIAARSRRAGATFLGLQYALTLYAALSMIGLVAAIAAGRPIKLVRFLGSYDPVDVYGTLDQIRGVPWSSLDALTPAADFAVLYLVVPAILIGPPTFLMGMSFPYLQKATQVDFARLGRRLGILLASNISGGVIGAVAFGWLFLPALGTAGSLKLLVATGAIIGVWLARVAWRDSGWRGVSGVVGVVVVTSAAVLAMPDAATLWARLHATTPHHVLFDEDGAGLSLLKLNHATSATTEVYVNGLGQSWLPYGNIHTALGTLPAFIHAAPTDVALIGLGSGDTAFGAAGRGEIRRLVSIEILGAQRRTLERLLRLQGYPGLRAVLTDPRIEHRVGDGRAFLVQADRMFDVIEADALRPSSAHAGNLYSREYFDLVSRRLKPGGLAVTWAPTERIRSTFLGVYPHVLAFAGDIWIGSDSPIPFDRDTVTRRLAAERHYYEAAGVHILEVLRPYLQSPPLQFGPGDRRAATEINTDLFPRDEFALPFW